VAPGKFYEAPIDWAFNNNITTGKTATTFEPDAGVTRGESVTFLKRYNDNIVKQTVGSLACTTGQIPVFGGADWACGSDQTVPDTNTDALGSLSCTTDQVAHYDGTDWVCGTTKLVVGLTSAGNSNIPINLFGENFGESSSIAIGTDGRPVITHFGATSGDLLVSHCNAPDCSTGAITTTLDTGGEGGVVGQESAITIGSDGFPIISYMDSNATTLKSYHCADLYCSITGTTTVLNSPGGSGPFGTSIVIGTDGLPIISYGTMSSLETIHCTAVDCSGGGTVRPLDSGFIVSVTSIAIGTDGFPIISYQDFTNENLKAYHCTAIDCSTGAPETLDTGGTGYSTSVAIGADGLPIISYTNTVPPAGNLRGYHCGTVSCSTGNATAALDTWNTGGVSNSATTSIASGADGLPIITYTDSSNGHLKAYRCDIADCSTGGTSATLDNTTTTRYADLTIGFDGRPIASYVLATSTGDKLMVARVSPTLTVGFG